MARNKELAVLTPLWAGLADGHYTVPAIPVTASEGRTQSRGNLADAQGTNC